MSDFTDMLSSFSDWTVMVTPITVTQAPNASGVWVDADTELTEVEGLIYTKSVAERYFNLTLSESVTDALITHSSVLVQT